MPRGSASFSEIGGATACAIGISRLPNHASVRPDQTWPPSTSMYLENRSTGAQTTRPDQRLPRGSSMHLEKKRNTPLQKNDLPPGLPQASTYPDAASATTRS